MNSCQPEMADCEPPFKRATSTLVRAPIASESTEAIDESVAECLAPTENDSL